MNDGPLNYWRVDIPTLVGCNWQDIVSEKLMVADTSSIYFRIWLYNGWFNDGNDLVIDNIRIVALDRIGFIAFNLMITNYNGLTYTLIANSQTLAPGCLDQWYLYKDRMYSPNLVASGTATPALVN
jgi:hypothetical protein